MTTEFGNNMRAIRESRGMTLDEMAKRLNTTKQALSRYERGERMPKITVASQFAEALGIPLEELVGVEALEVPPKEEQPKNDDVRLLIRGLNKLSPAQIEQAKNVFRAMFALTDPYLFDDKKGDDDK